MHGWLPPILAESIAVPLSAHLATLPLATAISGQVSMVGIVTNAVAEPFVGPATILGFSAAGLSLISPFVAALAGRLACWSAQPLLWTAHLGAALPGASWKWPAGPLPIGLLGAVCLGLTERVSRGLGCGVGEGDRHGGGDVNQERPENWGKVE